MNAHITKHNIDEHGRFVELKNTVDKTKAKQYLEQLNGQTIAAFKVNVEVDKLLRAFILNHSTLS